MSVCTDDFAQNIDCDLKNIILNSTDCNDAQSAPKLLATLDLGSNSFHLLIARVDYDELRPITSLSQKVQLALGLDENNVLSEDAISRALHCLQDFSKYLEQIDPKNIKIVATNALRQAVNKDEFMHRAQTVIDVPIHLISGREEARLIYLGVSHTNAYADKRLVIDIGGGSSEFIIGQGFKVLCAESLQMGCVSFTAQFFSNGTICAQNFNQAVNAAKIELLSIKKRYKATGWTQVIGTSGSLKAATLAINELGFGKHISYNAIQKLKQYVIDCGHSQNINLECIKNNRRTVFAAAVAKIYAIMQSFEIDDIIYSSGALREGVLYDMLGRKGHENVRIRSVQALMERYCVSIRQAKSVATTARQLFDDYQNSVRHLPLQGASLDIQNNKDATHDANAIHCAKDASNITDSPLAFAQDDAHNTYVSDDTNFLPLDKKDGELLMFAALLHEIGLAVSHHSHQNHSAYLLKYSDMFGFSRPDQAILSTIVQQQRRKIKPDAQKRLKQNRTLCAQALMLRLAVLANVCRTNKSANLHLSIKKNAWHVYVGEGKNKALIMQQLRSDVAQFAKVAVRLCVHDAS